MTIPHRCRGAGSSERTASVGLRTAATHCRPGWPYMTTDMHWILVRELDAAGVRALGGRCLDPDQSLTVGREGQLPLGVAVSDSGISRVAVTVTATVDG